MTGRFELKLCNNGSYYVWFGNELVEDEKGNYINFDKFNKESAESLVSLLNMYLDVVDECD